MLNIYFLQIFFALFALTPSDEEQTIQPNEQTNWRLRKGNNDNNDADRAVGGGSGAGSSSRGPVSSKQKKVAKKITKNSH